MMKLMKISLISAVLATGAMAGEYTYLPKVIEAGATVNLNQDIMCYTNIDNYGAISSTNGAVTISGSGTLTNHDGQELNELGAVPEGNTIEGVNAAYGVTLGTATFDKDNISAAEGFTITNTSETGCDFEGLESSDLVYLGADEAGQTVSIKGGDGIDAQKLIKCHFGSSAGTTKSYALDLSKSLTFTGTFSNYMSGAIAISDSNSSTPDQCMEFNDTEINVPVTIATQTTELHLNFTGVVLNRDVTVGNNTTLHFSGNSKLSSGARLTIGTNE